jgi:DNA (cytosine-5)-methyltransferase 1
MSLGFRAAGCRILAGIDEDDVANATFLENFNSLQRDYPPYVPPPGAGNLLKFDLGRIPGEEKIDILIGGPPCQGFSHIGRAKLASLQGAGHREQGFEEDPRNELYKTFLSALRLWKPRAFVMENVPGMRSVRGESVADHAGGDLAESGYRVGYAVLNSVWYGVPQFRERLFFVGIRSDLGVSPVMPPATHQAATVPIGYSSNGIVSGHSQHMGYLPLTMHYELAVNQERVNAPATTVHDALGDLPEITDHLLDQQLPRGDFRRILSYPCPPHAPYSHLMRSWPGFGALDGVIDHAIRRTKRDYVTFGRMEPGDRYPQAIAIAAARIREKVAEEIGKAKTHAAVLALEQLRSEFDSARSCGAPFKVWSPALAAFAKEIFPPYPEDKFVDKWRKLIPGQPSWTVTAHLGKDSYSHIHYDDTQKRAISVREAARLQSFPDGFLFSGNMGDCYRQIGNAVPPVLSWVIADTLLRRLGFPSRRPPLSDSRT